VLGLVKWTLNTSTKYCGMIQGVMQGDFKEKKRPIFDIYSVFKHPSYLKIWIFLKFF